MFDRETEEGINIFFSIHGSVFVAFSEKAKADWNSGNEELESKAFQSLLRHAEVFLHNSLPEELRDRVTIEVS